MKTWLAICWRGIKIRLLRRSRIFREVESAMIFHADEHYRLAARYRDEMHLLRHMEELKGAAERS